MTRKHIKIYLITLLALLGTLVYLEASAPQKLNWFPSYVRTDKIPLGTYAFFDAIKNQNPKLAIQEVSLPPYEYLLQDTIKKSTYLFINQSLDFDDHEVETLLDWVHHGNTLFISTKSTSNKLLDTLHLELKNNVSLENISTQPVVELTHENFKTPPTYHYDRDGASISFNKIDTCKTMVLGTMKLFEPNSTDSSTEKTPKENINKNTEPSHPEVRPNFIQQDFGEGTILLHTFPEAFSNYFILDKENYTYTQNLMSYIDSNQIILWDNYYKAGKKFHTSPLYILLGNRYLKWSYYLLLIGTILFVVFEGKRKQRSIPVITPLKNQTLEFTRTISGMYYEKQQHKKIVAKQIGLFFDYVRNVLRIPTDNLNLKAIHDIAARSSNTLEDTKAIFDYIDQLQEQTSISNEQLLKLYKMITLFKDSTAENKVS